MLLANNTFAEHSGPTPWVSNLVLQPKNDSSINNTLDMSDANKAIKKTNIYISRYKQMKSVLAGYKLFSNLDLKPTFHQLQISEKPQSQNVLYGFVSLCRYKILWGSPHPQGS